MVGIANPPVSLPSGGSFDMATLNKGLDAVVDRNSANRDAEINKALADASAEGGTSTAAPNALPDHKVYRVDSQLSAGTIVGEGKDAEAVGSQTVTEFRQVFDPTVPNTPTTSPEPIPADGVALEAGNHSTVIGMTAVGEGDVTAPAKTRRPGATDVPATNDATGEPGTTSNADAVEESILAGQQASEGSSN